MSSNPSKVDAAKILRTLPYEQGFHFTDDKGVHLGVTATSLLDFAMKLAIVEPCSIVYHYRHGHFQKWMKDTLGDEELANRISHTKKTYFSKSVIVVEDLRNDLLKIVQKRLSELQS